MDILDNKETSLPDNHPHYQELQEIYKGIEAGSALPPDSKQYTEAIQAFLDETDLKQKQKILKQYKNILFSAAVENILRENIVHARRIPDLPLANTIAWHLQVIIDCKVVGVNKTFRRFKKQEPRR